MHGASRRPTDGLRLLSSVEKRADCWPGSARKVIDANEELALTGGHVFLHDPEDVSARPVRAQFRCPHTAGATVLQLLYAGIMSVGFRPTEEDIRVIEANRREDEKTSDVIRRALRLLDREAWEERARADMHRLRSEDLSAEPDAWEYDADGSIRITGTGLTVPARPQDRA